MEIRYRIRKLEEVQAYLKTVPRGTVKVALRAIGDWMVGAPDRALRHYEPYKYVARAKAYGRSFFTEKQRRWFWANGGPDMIGNHRTGASADAWQWNETRGGYGGSAVNNSEGAKWLWSDSQAAQPAAVGHRKASDKIMTNIDGALRHARAAIRAFLKG